MEYKDYYKILGIDKKSSDKEIKKAYRRLARKYHPDVNPNDKASEARFKEINEAYEVLKDNGKRRKYDEFGQYWESADKMGAQGYGGTGGGKKYTYDFGGADMGSMFGGSGREGGFSDFFTSLFGGVRGKASSGFSGAGPGGFSFDMGGQNIPQPERGRDLEFPVQLTLKEAAFGTVKNIEFTKETVCSQCQGSGVLGSGLCQMCHGRGVLQKPRNIEVKIPPGVKDGFKIRMKGEGAVGQNHGADGDMYLVINIRKDPLYSLKNGDLFMDLPVTVTEAVLGAEVDVPTLHGRVSMKIPPKTQSGSVLRLREQGFPSLNNKDRKGDFFVKTRIVIPGDLSDEEKQLYEKLSSFSHDNPRADMFK